MKKSILFLLLTFFISVLFAQDVDLNMGLVANYPLDGKTGDLTGKNKNGKVNDAVATEGRDGRKAGAYRFKYLENSFISLPVDVGGDKLPVVTITAWLRPLKSTGAYPVISSGGNKKSRALYIDDYDNIYHWVLQCGTEGEIEGPVILTQKWVFVAMMYDGPNKEARLIVDNQFYKERAGIGGKQQGLVIGKFNGDVDDVRVYDRFLTLAELESLSGKKIDATQEDLVTEDRFAYKKEREKEEAESVKAGDIYIVNTSDFIVRDSAGGWGQKAILKDGDTVFVDSVIGKYLKISYGHGEFGYVSRSKLLDNAYPESGTSIVHTTKTTLQNIFDFTSLRSWIIVVICAIILFLAKKYFIKIDELLNRLRKKDIHAMGGSKSGALAEKQTVLNKVFPFEKLRWWSILPGFIGGIILFIALIFNGKETEWFFAQGFHLIPVGYDRWIHWLLFSLLWMLILALAGIIVESYVVTGPVIMWLRIILILILNCMSFLVSFYLAVVVTVIAIVMMILYALASSKSNYKCPHCGGTFSSSGGSGTCPHCGGGVRT
jgi:hypothetical protein